MHPLRRRPGSAWAPGLAAAALLAVVTACGAAPDSPGLDQAREQIDAALQKGTDNGVELVSLTQTDAVSGEMMGVPFRSIEFAGTLRATRNLYQTRSGASGFNGGCSFATDRKPRMGVCRDIARQLAAGETYAFTGKIDFTKKDSGWVPDKQPLIKSLSAAGE